MKSRHHNPHFKPDELRSLFKKHGIEHIDQSNAIITDCPLCKKPRKLYFYKNTGHFRCWYCIDTEAKFSGKADKGMATLLGVPREELTDVLYNNPIDDNGRINPCFALNLWFDGVEAEEEYEVVVSPKPLEGREWPMGFYQLDHGHSVKGLSYLRDIRKIPQDILDQYDIRYCPPKRAVAFPAQQWGLNVGYQTRSILPNKIITGPKAITKADRRDCLLFDGRLKGSKHAVICEGPIDALKAHLCGGNVATMGKAVSQGQIDLIRSHGIETVYLALDPDAMTETAGLAEKLQDLKVYYLPPAKGYSDLGEMPPEEVYEQFRSAELFHPHKIYLTF